MAAGEALSHVRRARVFVDDTPRRKALAELELALIELIEAEPDSAFRGAAWLQADNKLALEAARREREHAERLSERAPTIPERDECLRARLTTEYRAQVEKAVELVDPRSPRRCAAGRWRAVYALAIRAAAL